MDESLKRNAKDQVFKDLLRNRETLAEFYKDLTGKTIDPEEIVYDTIATSIVKGKEEDVAFQIGSRYIILFEAQSTWKYKDIIRFATYMFLLFINFVEANEDKINSKDSNVEVPAVEAYVIYTGSTNLPEVVSLNDVLRGKESMINAKMNIVTSKNAKGLVEQYIKFSNGETELYVSGKRSKKEIAEFLDFCINNNILSNYLKSRRKEVTNMIENFFTEEKRIQGIVNDALSEQKQQHKIEMENQLNKTILNLLNLNLKPEEIAKATDSSLETVNKVLRKNKK